MQCLKITDSLILSLILLLLYTKRSRIPLNASCKKNFTTYFFPPRRIAQHPNPAFLSPFRGYKPKRNIAPTRPYNMRNEYLSLPVLTLKKNLSCLHPTFTLCNPGLAFSSVFLSSRRRRKTSQSSTLVLLFLFLYSTSVA